MKNGDRVVYTARSLGTLEYEYASRFGERVVSKGEEGLYVGPHDNPELAEQGWHMTIVKEGEGALFVPVHDGQFEAA